MDIKLSNIVCNIKDYRLRNNDERTLFDWLVLKQHDFGLGKPFRHSVSQVQEATLTTKYLQKQVFAKFVSMGFLKLDKEIYLNNKYRTFKVDFTALSKPEILGQIIEPGTETYNNLISHFTHWASEQKKALKPLSKRKQKEIEAEEKAIDNLHTILVETWNNRVRIHNNKHPECTRMYVTTFAPSNEDKRLFVKLRHMYNDTVVREAFIVFADKVISGEIEPKKILPYFLKCNDKGEFSVVKECNDCFITAYRGGG